MKENIYAVIACRGAIFTKPVDFDYKQDLVGDVVWVPLNENKYLKARLRNESTDGIAPRMLLFELVPENKLDFDRLLSSMLNALSLTSSAPLQTSFDSQSLSLIA